MKKIVVSFISITLMLVSTDLSVFPAFSSPTSKESDKKNNKKDEKKNSDKNPYLDKTTNTNENKTKDKNIKNKEDVNPYTKDSSDKNPYSLEENKANNTELYKEYYNKILFELGFRQGVAINYPSNLSKFGLQGYNPGVGLSMDYYFLRNLGIHFEGTSFFTNNSFSIFIPVSLRYKFVTSPRFDLFIGLGGFGNYYSSKFSGGGLGEIGIMYKATNNFSLNATIDVGHNLIPEQATSAGLRFGGAFSL